MDLTRFLSIGAPRRETITVGDMPVTVRELTVGERADFMACARDAPLRLPILLVRLGVIHDDGSAVFTAEDEARIAALRPEVVDEVARAVMRVSGLGGDDDAGKAAP